MTKHATKSHQAAMTPSSDKNPVKVAAVCPKSIDEIKIYFSPDADQTAISDYSIKILKDILYKSCIKNARITSTVRSPYEQASAMYTNLTGKGPKQGIENQRKLYNKQYSGKVIDVYVDFADKKKTRDEIIDAMENKINELGPANISKHCGDHKILNVFDVSPGSIPKSKKSDFEEESSGHDGVSKFIAPKNNDPSYHFEVPQPKKKEEK